MNKPMKNIASVKVNAMNTRANRIQYIDALLHFKDKCFDGIYVPIFSIKVSRDNGNLPS